MLELPTYMKIVIELPNQGFRVKHAAYAVGCSQPNAAHAMYRLAATIGPIMLKDNKNTFTGFTPVGEAYYQLCLDIEQSYKIFNNNIKSNNNAKDDTINNQEDSN